MASVQEHKDALESARDEAFDAVSVSIGAIDTLLNFSMFVLGILALVLAFISFWGWRTISTSAEKRVKEVANDYLKAYIQGEEFVDLLQISVRDEVKQRVGNKVILNHINTEEQEKGEQDPFPSAKEVKKK